MKFVVVLLSIFMLVISISGCAGSPVRTAGEAEKNRSNMLELKIGMTKEQVLAIMGNPYKTESYQIDDKIQEFWLYLTEPGVGPDSHFTPLCFENEVLKGWGRNYYDNILRIQQDINIENR
jgi:hypothetical protein